ncbi:putative bifunctional diguanylate cyclase/phosphodiesterase [Schlesneria paludicola]|uniref:putative bifunctional diguanylate cyclase/phosphodiesterase n=1 Tax=Schlesneria paludicola TaxID=360056 RepID=UPI00029A1E4B|nr:EAL domain-containing protein [Schlesneria paludicola]
MTFVPRAVLSHRVLLIDDDPDIHELVAVVLASQNVELLSAMDGSSAIQMALNESLDLILLDFVLKGENGLEVLKQMRAAGVSSSIPVVFITGNENHRILSECFQAGAADYVRKPFCAAELRARVRSVLDRVSMMHQLELQALCDPLTRLCNRASIRLKIQAAISASSRRNFALLFLDFDRFKLVNDSLGHDVGDKLLQQIAERLSGALRSKDSVGHFSELSTAARLGGDEFVVLLEDLRHPDDAIIVAERLLSVLETPYVLSGQRVCCTASIGIVNDVKSYATSDQVLRDADTAMYEAKAAGKARYVLFDREMHFHAERRLRIDTDLRCAIESEEFHLVYQPIVSLETGTCRSVEALIRWTHPQHGLFLPAEFLPYAEESGLIVMIGAWMIDRTCEEFAHWQRTLGTSAPTSVHINISRKQLLRDLVRTIQASLVKHALPAECLHLEITESGIMEFPEVAISVLGELRQLGVKIEVDDFGTGYSSLACLLELPIDVLKIDKSFISKMERNRSFAAMVHAIITLGQNLGFTIVAEGIESADQLAMLQVMDCDFGQGFFLGKPMRGHEVEDFLRHEGPVVNLLAPTSILSTAPSKPAPQLVCQ